MNAWPTPKHTFFTLPTIKMLFNQTMESKHADEVKRSFLTQQKRWECTFPTIPDIKEDISLLAEYRSDITGRHDGVIHLVLEAVASL